MKSKLILLTTLIVSLVGISCKPSVNFKIIIPSYNNATWYKENLDSVANQDYTSWKIVYLDSDSTDNTVDLVEQYSKEIKISENVNIVRGNNKRSTTTLYKAVKNYCKDTDVVLFLDGCDKLAHTHVLSDIANKFSDPKIWLVHSTYSTPDLYKNPTTRHIQFPGAPVAIYARIIEKIRRQDIETEPDNVSYTPDTPIVTLAMQLTSGHGTYIPSIMYIQNPEKPECEKYIGGKEKFSHIAQTKKIYKPHNTHFDKSLVDVVSYSYNRPIQLLALLESIESLMTGTGDISVIYKADNQYQSAYDELTNQYPLIRFYNEDSSLDSFWNTFSKCTFDTSNAFIMFASDDDLVVSPVDLRVCTKALLDFDAYAFCLRMGENITKPYLYEDTNTKLPQHEYIAENIMKWTIGKGIGEWGNVHNNHMTILKKSTIKKQLEDIHPFNPDYTYAWSRCTSQNNQALCFDHSKVTNIPLNIVKNDLGDNQETSFYSTKTLLELFNKGLKIDFKNIVLDETQTVQCFNCNICFIENDKKRPRILQKIKVAIYNEVAKRTIQNKKRKFL